MKKTVYYIYLGTNGTICSPVHLEDIYYIRQFLLVADDGKFLTNGDVKVKTIMIPEDEINEWQEIDIGQI